MIRILLERQRLNTDLTNKTETELAQEIVDAQILTTAGLLAGPEPTWVPILRKQLAVEKQTRGGREQMGRSQKEAERS